MLKTRPPEHRDRDVYKPRTSDGQNRADIWYWQCNACADEHDEYGSADTWREAFDAAYAHAIRCPRHGSAD